MSEQFLRFTEYSGGQAGDLLDFWKPLILGEVVNLNSHNDDRYSKLEIYPSGKAGKWHVVAITEYSVYYDLETVIKSNKYLLDIWSGSMSIPY